VPPAVLCLDRAGASARGRGGRVTERHQAYRIHGSMLFEMLTIPLRDLMVKNRDRGVLVMPEKIR
jgi:hypothetical protein